MRSLWRLCWVTAIMCLVPSVGWGFVNFMTGIHGTRPGKAWWFFDEDGLHNFVTDEDLLEAGYPEGYTTHDFIRDQCQLCHGPTNAAGEPYETPYTPGCIDCHNPNDDFSVSQSQCYSCHGRQGMEAFKLGYSDVHRSAGMKCWDCHTLGDFHGDGNQYNSMLEPGAIDAECENCHGGPYGMPLPENHDNYDPHRSKLHCTACHSQTVISCYNCHFESKIEGHKKRAKQPIHGFMLLGNRIEDGKVHPMSFQSVSFKGHAFVAFGPFTPHSTTRHGRGCSDCHNMDGSNAAITEYNNTGQIHFVKWDDENKVLSWTHGVVPMPADYEQTFKMDFITYNGNPHDPVVPSTNWSSIGKSTWDLHQMYFITPMTREQMKKLGFINPEPPVFGIDLTVNNRDDFEYVTESQNVTVTISVTAGEREGDLATWWMLCNTVWGWYYWDPFTGEWTPGYYPSLVDFPITDIPSFTLYNNTLPAGVYTFWFGVFPTGENSPIDVVPVYVTR